MTIAVDRQGYFFEVEDTAVTASWEFWRLWGEGNWEADLLKTVEMLLPTDGLFIDVGAWIGPITLWAAQFGRVIAIEPDPVAFGLLEKNVALNDLFDRVELVNMAAGVDDERGTKLWPVQGWGSSTSSTTIKSGDPITVETLDLRKLIAETDPDLVKMDIEGGESIVFPWIGPVLRELKVPILLSLHPQDYDPAFVDAMEKELAQWHVDHLQAPGISLLCTP